MQVLETFSIGEATKRETHPSMVTLTERIYYTYILYILV